MMKKMEIEYNTSRSELIMPEYGRHVQLMVEYAKTIEDLSRRQSFVEKIVELMYIMNPQSRGAEDYRERLWKHVFRIGSYELDGVVPLVGALPTKENDRKTPEKVPYSSAQVRFRHYGHHIQSLIASAINLEEGPIREGLIAAIAAYMKLAYKTWNKDLNVGDETIKNDLKALSNGKLSMSPEASIEDLNPNPQQLKKGAPQPPQHQQPRSQQHNNQQGKRQGQQRNNKNKPWKRK
jgi:hypothetical protein